MALYTGLSWLLSDEQARPGEAAWQEALQRTATVLASAAPQRQREKLAEPVLAWLSQQRALAALGERILILKYQIEPSNKNCSICPGQLQFITPAMAAFQTIPYDRLESCLSISSAAGWLAPERQVLLQRMGLLQRSLSTDADRSWDEHLGLLLAHRRRHGHCQVARHSGLRLWLDARLGEWREGRLPQRRAAQLAALNIQPRL